MQAQSPPPPPFRSGQSPSMSAQDAPATANALPPKEPSSSPHDQSVVGSEDADPKKIAGLLWLAVKAGNVQGVQGVLDAEHSV